MQTDEAISQQSSRLEELAQDPALMVWQDAFELDYASLRQISQKHDQILSGTDAKQIERIGRLHTMELENPVDCQYLSKINILNHLKSLAEKGRITRTLFAQLHDAEEKDEVVSFQRERYFGSNKFRKNNGRFIEMVKVYPNGQRVRSFHATFDNQTDLAKYAAGQNFHYGLVNFIKQKVGGESSSIARKYIAKSIARCDPEAPTYADDNSRSMVFLNGQNMMQYLAKKSTEERVEALREVVDIDMIVSYFANEFEATKKGKECATYDDPLAWVFSRRTFERKDSHKEVIEEIILKADNDLRRQLIEKDILTREGKLRKRTKLDLFYKDERIKGVCDLLELDAEEDEREIAFSEKDVNLGNVMRQNGTGSRYTLIDFERARKEHYMAKIAGRVIFSGVLDKNGNPVVMENGESAESKVVDSAYKTLLRLAVVDDKGWNLDRETFESNYARYRKRWLLRAARRFKEFAADYSRTGETQLAEKSRKYMKFYYKAFVNQVTQEVDDGKLEICDLEGKLDYLNDLFGNPVSDDRMPELDDDYNPSFRNIEDFRPTGIDEKLMERNSTLAENYSRRRKTRTMLKWLAVGVAVLGTIIGYDTIMGMQKRNAKLKKEKDRIAMVRDIFQKGARMDDYDAVLLEKFDRGGYLRLSNNDKRNLFDYYHKLYKDKYTAAVACLDYGLAVDAIRAAGFEGKVGKEKIPYKKALEPYVQKLDWDVWVKISQIDGGVDNWMMHPEVNLRSTLKFRKELKAEQDMTRRIKYGRPCVHVKTPHFPVCKTITVKKPGRHDNSQFSTSYRKGKHHTTYIPCASIMGSYVCKQPDGSITTTPTEYNREPSSVKLGPLERWEK